MCDAAPVSWQRFYVDGKKSLPNRIKKPVQESRLQTDLNVEAPGRGGGQGEEQKER